MEKAKSPSTSHSPQRWPPILVGNALNQNKPFERNLPSWINFHLKSFKKNVKYSATVIMAHYLVVLVQDEAIAPKYRGDSEGNYRDYDSLDDDPASLLVFDLLDYSVQEAEIDVDLFAYQEEFSFVRYGENQIIKYYSNEICPESFVCIMIEAFKPFKVRCEKLKENTQRLQGNTAQIYKDYFYAYGKVIQADDYGFGDGENELWRFDLKNHVWKLCETFGEGPVPTFYMRSFIFEEYFCVYGGYSESRDDKHLFKLNLNSMKWVKVEQEEEYLLSGDDQDLLKGGGVVYKDHLITLKKRFIQNENALCCLNLYTQNTWSIFDIADFKKKRYSYFGHNSGVLVYKDLLLTCIEGRESFEVAILNLENLGVSAPKKPEEKCSSSLFMSQNESDVTFEVEGHLIPAHKKILMRKSRYFANVFNSGMVESRQAVIEIKQCQYDVFKEYLRFVYQEKVNIENEDLATKLYILADKYLQEDFREKCQHLLVFLTTRENVYKILDFAIETNIFAIKNWCIKFFDDNLKKKNMAQLIKYIEKQEDQEIKEKLTSRAFTFVLTKFHKLCTSQWMNIKLYEDFLIENIEMDTISSLASFLGDFQKLWSENTRHPFEKFMTRLKETIYNFVEENVEVIMTGDILKSLSKGFLADFILYSSRKNRELKIREKKRMEPGNDESKEEEEEEDNHELKKTKKYDSAA